MKILKFDKAGFSLVELLVVMGLLVIVLAISSGNFTTLLKALKGESKTAETEVEKIVGLEILRQDIENSGYGLPWFVDTNDWSALNGYSEASSQTVCGTNNINTYNDAPNNAPRAIISGDNVCSDGSDYLVIKSSVVRNLAEAQKWTYIWNDGTSGKLNTWATTVENINNNSQVIAVNPKENVRDRVLVTYTSGGSKRFYTTYANSTSNYQPRPSEVYILFAIGDDSSLRMPFNRADYFINKNNVPSRCASGTGVLTKATLSHGDGKLSDYSPLLDCVADMQIVFGVDITTPSADGQIDCYTNDLSKIGITMDAENIRNRVKEVRAYILAHEGQMDRDYRFGNSKIMVGASNINGLIGCDASNVDKVLGREYDLSGITNWQNYRWKVYTLAISPDNLRGR